MMFRNLLRTYGRAKFISTPIHNLRTRSFYTFTIYRNQQKSEPSNLNDANLSQEQQQSTQNQEQQPIQNEEQAIQNQEQQPLSNDDKAAEKEAVSAMGKNFFMGFSGSTAVINFILKRRDDDWDPNRPQPTEEEMRLYHKLARKALLYATLINIALGITIVLVIRYWFGIKSTKEFKMRAKRRILQVAEKLGIEKTLEITDSPEVEKELLDSLKKDFPGIDWDNWQDWIDSDDEEKMRLMKMSDEEFEEYEKRELEKIAKAKEEL